MTSPDGSLFKQHKQDGYGEVLVRFNRPDRIVCGRRQAARYYSITPELTDYARKICSSLRWVKNEAKIDSSLCPLNMYVHPAKIRVPTDSES